MDLREALAANSRAAPLTEVERARARATGSRARAGVGPGAVRAELRRHRRRGASRRLACASSGALAEGCLRLGAGFVPLGGLAIAGSIEAGGRLAARRSSSTLRAPGPTMLPRLAASGRWASQPKRRTIVQLRVGRTGLSDLPLVNDAPGASTSRARADIASGSARTTKSPAMPCDAAPEEIDVAIAIDRFEACRRLAGRGGRAELGGPQELRARPAAGLRIRFECPGFFWCAGQGGFGIQTSPAAAKLCAALLLGEDRPMVAHIEPGGLFAPRFDHGRK